MLLVLLLSYLYQGSETLQDLNRIESERDHWQRPSEVIQALNLREGSVVVDFGSGVGYFALKLSPVVGKSGSVIAEDIRRESLAFLRIRAFVRWQPNIRTIRGEIDDLRLSIRRSLKMAKTEMGSVAEIIAPKSNGSHSSSRVRAF